MKKITYLIGFLLVATLSFAQQTIKGVVKDAETKLPLSNVLINIEDTKLVATTNEKGEFRFTKVPKGKKVLVFNAQGHQIYQKEVNSDEPKVSLGALELNKADKNNITASTESIQTILLDDTDSNSETTDEQNVSSQLGDSRDLFRKYTNYNWSAVRYRTRGYISNYVETYFNGVPYNDLDDDRASFNTYSGLNDVTRNNQNYVGLIQNTFAFGDLAGASNIDTRASMQRKQKKISYTSANRNYRNRLMGTYSTGLMPNGWAVTLSGSRRWAQEAYLPGTFMDAWAYFGSVDKVLNKKHSLNLTFFGSPSKQALAAPTLLEMVDLSNDIYYNHNWGFQEGKIRNFAVTKRHAPTAVLRHDFNINSKTKLITAASFQSEKNARGNIGWYNARQPLPDYYGFLPSAIDDPVQKLKATEFFKSSEANRQINWNYFYQTNYSSNETIVSESNGNTTSTTGKRAKYMLADDNQDSKELNLYSNLDLQVNDVQQLAGGIGLRYSKGHDYRTLTDLLGADFAVDVDSYSDRDLAGGTKAQNDLRNINRILKVGDKMSYDYDNNVRNAYIWGQSSWNLNKFDFFVSAKSSVTSFWRVGNTQNGRFPDNSLGQSEKKSFFNYGFKGGASYKFDGRNYIGFHAGYLTKAPNSRDSYLSPRTRNEFAPNIKNEKISSVEAFYNHRAPKLAIEITGYYTLFQNKTRAFSFYSDEDRTFVNYIAQGLDMRHCGIEAAAQYSVTNQLQVYLAGTISQNLFWSRPTSFSTPDNGNTNVQNNLSGQTLYLKGFFIPNTPQTAATAGFAYFAKNRWTFRANANYFGRRYMDINYNRRTSYAVTAAIGKKDIVPNSEQWNDIIAQQKLDDAVTVSLSIGKSKRIKDGSVGISFGVDNLLNTTYVSSAFEQWRFDAVDKDVNKFPPRYYYAQGRNYLAILTYIF